MQYRQNRKESSTTMHRSRQKRCIKHYHGLGTSRTSQNARSDSTCHNLGDKTALASLYMELQRALNLLEKESDQRQSALCSLWVRPVFDDSMSLTSWMTSNLLLSSGRISTSVMSDWFALRGFWAQEDSSIKARCSSILNRQSNKADRTFMWTQMDLWGQGQSLLFWPPVPEQAGCSWPCECMSRKQAR